MTDDELLDLRDFLGKALDDESVAGHKVTQRSRLGTDLMRARSGIMDVLEARGVEQP